MIEIDKIFPQIRIEGREIDLSKKEFDLFLLLWENKGRICTRTIIHNAVWGSNSFNTDRITDITVARLRKKLEQTELKEKLITKKGFGYTLNI